MLSGVIQIGVLSNRTGLSVDTIRFYERQRLLPPVARSCGGFRLFREEDAAVLQFIKSAQELGFSLGEIRELLALRQDRSKACPKTAALLRTKLACVKTKIADLRVIEAELQSALGKCDVTLHRSRTVGSQPCPVLDDISWTRRRKRSK